MNDDSNADVTTAAAAAVTSAAAAVVAAAADPIADVQSLALSLPDQLPVLLQG